MPADRFTLTTPAGDDRERRVCGECGFIDYENPKVVVGAVATASDGRILLCRRAIAPQIGLWTIPAGYMELNETAADGAAREAWEEARAKLAIDGVLAVYSIPRISQVQIIHRARLRDDAVSPGPESQAVDLFAADALPWDALAFPSVAWALQAHLDQIGRVGPFAAVTEPVDA